MEHNITTSAMSLSLLARNVYCVCFTDRDSQDTLRGELARARERFFSGNRKAVRVGSREMIRGFEGKLQGKLSRRSFFWRKSAAHVAGRDRLMLEEAFDQLGGYVVVTRDFRGVIASRIFYDKTLLWLKSEYYEPWDSRSARVIFKPVDTDDKIERFDWDSAKMRYRSTMLYPVPYQEGTAEQNLLNARFGEPKLLVSTKEGVFSYCPEKEAQARKAAAEELKGGTLVILPAWEVKDGALTVEDDPDEADITFPSLEEYALIQSRPAEQLPQEAQPPEEEPAEAAAPPQVEEAPKEEDSQPQAQEEKTASPAAPEQVEKSPEEGDGQPQVQEEKTASPAASEQVEKSPEKETNQPQAQEEKTASPAAPEQAEKAPEEGNSQPQAQEEKTASPAASEQEAKAPEETESIPVPSVDKILQAARELAAKELDSSVPLHDPEDPVSRAILYAAREAAKAWQKQALQPQPEPVPPTEEALAKEEPQTAAPVKEPAPEKDAVSTPALQQAADLPPVHGRTQQPGGFTVYEGQFREGQRDGFGVAFYKDGTPSYTGSWKEGKRDGLGVSFRDSDHAVHISRWKNGAPEDFVSLFDKEGNLRYGGRIEKGKKQGPGVSYNTADGTVFVGKWVDGRPTGVGSAFDREGNLVYYGEWKNGQRSGHGTQFDSTGGIVFDGEWKDGKYYNGILYQKMEELPEEDQQ